MGKNVESGVPTRLRVATLVVLVAMAFSLGVMLYRGAGLRFVSGSWAALAVDASQGVLYRPLMGPLGYGGTRYMPLHFVLHGISIRAISDAVAGGALITALSAAGLLTGVYALLRARDVPRAWAICGAVLSLGAIASQLAITTIRGDLLPAALNVCGLAVIARTSRGGATHTAIAALLFALAFSAKVTTLFGLAACVTFLLSEKHRTAAVRLAGISVLGILAMATTIYMASSGRVLESMSVTGSGGAGLGDISLAPIRFAMFACIDLGFLPFFLAASIALALQWRSARRDLLAHTFTWTLAATVFIFGSPGIDFNHLLDLHVIGVVLLIDRMFKGTLSPLTERMFTASGYIAALAVLVVSALAWYAFPVPLNDDRRNAYALAKDPSGPVFSEDPWVPILGKEHPFLLDPFNLRIACQRDEAVKADLWKKIEDHYFSGVVITPIEDPKTKAFQLDGRWIGKTYYGEIHFPPGFIEHLYQHYKPAGRFHSYLVLKPNNQGV